MKFNNYLFGFAFLICLVFPKLVFASEIDGTIVSGTDLGYAWSDTAGWINFSAAAGNIHVTDTALTGFAWSSNYGWINLAPSNSGITNNGEGILDGYAWSAGLGWINFSGVEIDANGLFSGTATGSLAGTLTFDCTNCTVSTDWRPLSVRSSVPPPPTSSGGGGSLAEPALTTTPTVPQFPETGSVQDLDPVKDGIINILDFNTMMVDWDNKTCGNIADMNKDCMVDVFDFNMLMVLWGTTYE